MAKGKRTAGKAKEQVKEESEHEEQSEREEEPEKEPEQEEQSVSDLWEDLRNRQKELEQWVKDQRKALSVLEKRCNKELKGKGKKKQRKENSNKQPAGFNKGVPVPKELFEFFKKYGVVYYEKEGKGKEVERAGSIEEGQEIPRTMVTKYIYGYIKKNKLQDPKDKRNTNPDAALQALFGLTPEVKITFGNFQQLLGRYYVKKTVEKKVSKEAVEEVAPVDKSKKKATSSKVKA